MENLKYRKCAVWIAISVLVGLLQAVHVFAQPGFISVLCGGKTNHTDENNITWVTDANYIDVGETTDTGTANLPSYLQTIRFFPKPLKKSCYHLPVTPDVPYVLRVWFVGGDNSNFQTSFILSTETTGMLYSYRFTVEKNPIHYEQILVSSGRVLYICLIRLFENDDPFINAIELRILQEGMYPQAKPGTMLYLSWRCDVGGRDSTIRYPQDNFDRIWTTDINPISSNGVRNISTQAFISNNKTNNLPPTVVMQTAWVTNLESYGVDLGSSYGYWKTLLLLYFAQIEALNVSETSSFYVKINGERRSDIVTTGPSHSAVELPILSDKTDTFRFDLYKANNFNRGLILNAFEFYVIFDTELPTYSQDLEALEAVKRRFDIKDWISDPCYSTEWDGIVCHTDIGSSAKRIVDINLSGWNLTGLLPQEIGRLNAIVNVSLENNHLKGPLPNFSNLTKLERLHLQNNNFSGTVPEWLSNLKNLKELFIENNNFTGVIPQQLLDKPSLELKYTRD